MGRSPVIALTLIAANALAPAWSRSDAASVADILQVVEQYPKRLQSARVEGTSVSTPTKAFYSLHQMDESAKGLNTKKESVVWAFKGDKRYRQSVERFDPHSLENQGADIRYKLISRAQTDIFDGRDQYNLISSRYTGQKTEIVQGTLGRRLMTDAPILNFGYQVFGQWVGDRLKSEHCRLDGTEEHPRFGKLYRFSVDRKARLLPQLTGRKDVEARMRIRFWLAPKYGFLAVRSESEGKDEAKKQRLVLRMSLAERRGSIWFPVEGFREWYSVQGSKETLLSKNQFTVQRFTLNSVPDSLFQVNLKPGYHIHETETNKSWKVGANGERIPIIPRSKSTGVMPIGWLFMISLTSILLLAAGAFLRWRRRFAS